MNVTHYYYIYFWSVTKRKYDLKFKNFSNQIKQENMYNNDEIFIFFSVRYVTHT